MTIQRKTIRTHNIMTFMDQIIEAAQQGYARDPANTPRRSFGNQFMAYLIKSDVNDGAKGAEESTGVGDSGEGYESNTNSNEKQQFGGAGSVGLDESNENTDSTDPVVPVEVKKEVVKTQPKTTTKSTKSTNTTKTDGDK